MAYPHFGKEFQNIRQETENTHGTDREYPRHATLGARSKSTHSCKPLRTQASRCDTQKRTARPARRSLRIEGLSRALRERGVKESSDDDDDALGADLNPFVPLGSAGALTWLDGASQYSTKGGIKL